MHLLNKPVLIIAFNRPEVTVKVFDAVKKAKPPKIYFAVDGPRNTHPADASKCEQVIDIFKDVNWPCEVKQLYRNENLGCRMAVSSAITWFFEQEEMGIILEDDCLPNPSFFHFCEHNLNKYHADERIMHIGGTNFQNGIKRGQASYYFSRMCHVWGWASWRRAWANYDINLQHLDAIVEQKLLDTIITHPKYRANYIRSFKQTQQGLINTWDYQWVYSVWKSNGLSIIPNVNLVSNIGFGEDATHTTDQISSFANNKTYQIGSIVDPLYILPDNTADEFSLKNANVDNFRIKRYLKKASAILKRTFKT